MYFPGGGAERDADGNFWLLGLVDDVMNVAGHRIGTMEVESALVDHPAVAEAAVVGVSDELEGAAIAAFVIRKEKARADGVRDDQKVHEALRAHVAKRSARSRDPITSSSPPTSRRPGRARSCVGCCATSRRRESSAARRCFPTRPSSST